MRISACMIVKNEEEDIGRCIRSIKDAVDEIIVVDTGSTDRTVAIAQELGAHIFYFTWIDDFSAAKNAALDRASGDWIIFLDADEWFPDEVRGNIIPLLTALHDKVQVNALECEMRNLKKEGIYIVGRVVRIFRRCSNIRYVGSIHECLSAMNRVYVKAEVLYLNHSGYMAEQMKKKEGRNLQLLERRVVAGNADDLTYGYISVEYFNIGNYKLALQYAQLAKERAIEKKLNYHSLVKQYIIAIDSMYHLPEKYTNDYILEEINSSLEKFPDHPDLYCWRARILFRCEQYPLALQTYLFAIRCNEEYHNQCYNAFLKQIAIVYYHMATIYRMQHEEEQALIYYIKLLELDRHNDQILHCVLSLIKKRPADEALRILKSVYHVNNMDDITYLAKHL